MITEECPLSTAYSGHFPYVAHEALDPLQAFSGLLASQLNDLLPDNSLPPPWEATAAPRTGAILILEEEILEPLEGIDLNLMLVKSLKFVRFPSDMIRVRRRKMDHCGILSLDNNAHWPLVKRFARGSWNCPSYPEMRS
jgi:hypothetical protein